MTDVVEPVKDQRFFAPDGVELDGVMLTADEEGYVTSGELLLAICGRDHNHFFGPDGEKLACPFCS